MATLRVCLVSVWIGDRWERYSLSTAPPPTAAARAATPAPARTAATAPARGRAASGRRRTAAGPAALIRAGTLVTIGPLVAGLPRLILLVEVGRLGRAVRVPLRVLPS